MHQITKDYVLYVKGIDYEEIKEQIEYVLNRYLNEDIDDAHKSINLWKSEIFNLLQGIAQTLEILNIQNKKTTDIFYHLGIIFYYAGEYNKAEKYYKKALEIRKKVLPPNHPHLKTTYKNLAYLYKEIGRKEEAERYFRLAGED